MPKSQNCLAVIVFFGAFQMMAACSGNSINPQVLSLSAVLEPLSTQKAFHTTELKTKFHGGVLYSLIYHSETPTDEGRASLVAHSLKGVQLPVQQLPSEFTLTDFDVLPDGRLVQLGFTSEESERGSALRLCELTVFIDAQKIFTFRDAREQTDPMYDDKGNRLPLDPPESDRTLFLNNRSSYPFAQVITAPDRLFLAASGLYTTKLFSFDFSGKELGQVELLPQVKTEFARLPREFTRLVFSEGRLFAALSVYKEEACALQRHLVPTLDCSGPDSQILLQSFDSALQDRQAHLLKSSADLFLNGMVADGKRLAVFGHSSERRQSKALVVTTDTSLSDFRYSEKDLGATSWVTAAAFSGNELLIGGMLGWEQVETGSVVKSADAFLGKVDAQGDIQVQNRFGTERDDFVVSIQKVGEETYVGAVVDGPITHTADTDAAQGYNRWFLGKLKR